MALGQVAGMTRRDVLRLLGALPVVGPALLAVGANVIRPRNMLVFPPGNFTKRPGLTVAKLREAQRVLEANYVRPAEVLGWVHHGVLTVLPGVKCVMGPTTPLKFTVENRAVLEAFYRGRG